MPLTYPGINIQYPVSRLILSGEKTIETRTYPLPIAYTKQPLILIETPGQTGNFKARMIGLIQFDGCFLYPSKDAFYADEAHHKVTPDSPWAWRQGQQKWGWPVQVLKIFETPLLAPKRRGIVLTKDLKIEESTSGEG